MVWVVKIGGSLANDKRLTDWLELISDSHQPIVVVPGGGPFANQVRAAQSFWQFSDNAAHHMSILGMQQFGYMLTDLNKKLDSAVSASEVNKKLKSGYSSIVWIPTLEELVLDNIPASWDVTADSLAVWVCKKISADYLMLIKSLDMTRYVDCSIQILQENGIVDPAFKKMLLEIDCPFKVIGVSQMEIFTRL